VCKAPCQCSYRAYRLKYLVNGPLKVCAAVPWKIQYVILSLVMICILQIIHQIWNRMITMMNMKLIFQVIGQTLIFENNKYQVNSVNINCDESSGTQSIAVDRGTNDLKMGDIDINRSTDTYIDHVDQRLQKKTSNKLSLLRK